MSTANRAAVRSELVAAAIRNCGHGQFRARGGSMNPWVRDGDVVLVRRAAASAVRPGDVVAFERSGCLFAHRLVKRSGDGLITKGDALPHLDSPVAADELLGQVVGVVRGGRTVSFETRARHSAARLLVNFPAYAGALHSSARALKRMIAWIRRPAGNPAIPKGD